jgi:TRAP-type transport system periplasmic protein
MKGFKVVGAVSAALLFALTGCSKGSGPQSGSGAASASSGQTYTLSLATWGTSTHPQVKIFAHDFMKQVEKDSNGRIKFKFFPDSQMVKEAFVSTAVPGDTVDISLTTTEGWAGRIPDMSATASPVWNLTMQETRDQLVPGKPIFDYFNKKFQSQGAVALALFDIGPPIFSTTFPLQTPNEVVGKRIRAVSKGTAETLQALGASPVTMSVGDVYSALKLGTVDGAMGGLQGAYGLKHYEVARNVLATGGVLGTFIHGYVMNKQKFDSLPKDLQDILVKDALAVRNETEDALIKSYPEYLQKMQQGGAKVTELKKGDPLWNQWSAKLDGLKKKDDQRYSPELIKLLPK